MASDMATLEASVQYMTVGWMLGTNGFKIAGQRRIATGTIEGAQIEVRQTAVKQMRDLRTNGMRIKQQRIAKLVFHAIEFLLQGLVIGFPDLLQVRRTLLFRRHQPFTKQWHAIKQRGREQTCGSAHIHRRIVLRAIEVNHKPRILGCQGAGTQLAGKVVKLRDMPVGVRQALRLRDQPGLDCRSQFQTSMGHADQQRHAALFECQNLVHKLSPKALRQRRYARRVCPDHRPANKPGLPDDQCSRRQSRPPCRAQASRGSRPCPMPLPRAG